MACGRIDPADELSRRINVYMCVNTRNCHTITIEGCRQIGSWNSRSTPCENLQDHMWTGRYTILHASFKAFSQRIPFSEATLFVKYKIQWAPGKFRELLANLTAQLVVIGSWCTEKYRLNKLYLGFSHRISVTKWVPEKTWDPANQIYIISKNQKEN